MPIDITINDISGSSPFNIYLCDDPINVCVYIDTISSTLLPYIFTVPSIMSSQVSFNIKIIDNNKCVSTKNLQV